MLIAALAQNFISSLIDSMSQVLSWATNLGTSPSSSSSGCPGQSLHLLSQTPASVSYCAATVVTLWSYTRMIADGALALLILRGRL